MGTTTATMQQWEEVVAMIEGKSNEKTMTTTYATSFPDRRMNVRWLAGWLRWFGTSTMIVAARS